MGSCRENRDPRGGMAVAACTGQGVHGGPSRRPLREQPLPKREGKLAHVSLPGSVNAAANEVAVVQELAQLQVNDA